MRLGIDIGGTNTDVVALDAAGAVAARHRVATGHGPAAVVATTVRAVEETLAAVGVPAEDLTSVGAGVPGVVREGRVRHAMNLGITDLDLAGELTARLGPRVAVENDVNAAALGVWHASGSPGESLAYLNLGTGLAAGLVLHGRLWRGARGAAGELGHILVDPAGPTGPDGQRGGLETLASGSGIASQWQRGVAHPVHDMLAAAGAGDPRALAVRQGLFDGVATAVRILVLTLDVDRVVIGGGISNLGSPLLDGVRAVFARWSAADSPFVASLGLAERVEIARSDVPHAALGAALVGALARGADADGAVADRAGDPGATWRS